MITCKLNNALRRGHLISKTSHRSIEMTYEHR